MRKLNIAYLAPVAVLLLVLALPGGISFGEEEARNEEARNETDGQAAGTESAPAEEESAAPQPEKQAAAPAPAPYRAPAEEVMAAAQRPTSPPTNLKLVGDHWTPWNPPDPESFPPEATLHIIVRGDTLWDLADLTFNDPYLWPQIWNQNRYILDSHWIYPGDPLLIPMRPVVVTPAGPNAASPQILPQGQEGAPQAAFPPPPGDGDGNQVQSTLTAQEPPAAPAEAPSRDEFGGSIHSPQPLIDRSDLSCSGFIGDKKTGSELFIAGQQETAKVGLTLGDLVYLNVGKDDVQPGAEFSIVYRASEISHPESGRRIGWYYERTGRLKVLAAYDASAVAEITLACDEIRAGQELVPHELQPFPMTQAPPFDPNDVMSSGNEIGFLVHTKDDMKVVATGNVVFVDLGSEDGLKPGDILTAFEPAVPSNFIDRGGISYDYEWGNARFEQRKLKKGDASNFPPRLLGQLVVMDTESHTATAKVIYSVAEMHVGTMVEPR
ncbi:MAG TPA: LysM peptidoglycan-binding domain-containing protein [Candidatus Polarisedimenticolia bacterium]|nr:LysM peptidoglycan-binding domain-containing protein [Candidatus Polarisedimenticolia bacterium]